MRIIYIANIRLPTEKAHGLQVMSMCAAFASLGHEVVLVVPTRKNIITEDPFLYYAIEPSFSIQTVTMPDFVAWGRVGFFMQSVWFGLSVPRAWLCNSVVYGRDEWVFATLMLRGVRSLVWETHTGAWNAAARFITGRVQLVVAITEGLKRWYVSKGVEAHRIVVAPDGVDLAPYANAESKEQARQRLGIPLNLRVALYVGRVDGWKGVGTLCEAASLLPTDVRIVVAGGEQAQVAQLASQYPNVTFLGYRPMRDLPNNLAAADVLVLPNTGRDRISTEFTSPLKLFAYMAANRPIVASNLPSIREVLDDTSAVLVEADNPQALADGITVALLPWGRECALRARGMVARYTWSARAAALDQNFATIEM